MLPTPTVSFYLDFVSPYSWLALAESERFAARHGIRWELRPIVYAALLQAHGLVGPAETPAKRRYTFHDVARRAHRIGLRFVGPPEHPFRSLEALRALHVFRGDPRALRLAVRLAESCWSEGRPLTDARVILEAVESVGLDPTDLEKRIGAPEIKRGLRESTEQAVKLGVFGVPTFVFNGELFWGHDRLDDLALCLSGEAPPVGESVERFLARPRGAERKGAPRPASCPEAQNSNRVPTWIEKPGSRSSTSRKSETPRRRGASRFR